MLVANIPLSKLNNPQFKDFLAKYTGQNSPAESTLRIEYIDSCYTEIMNEIKKTCRWEKNILNVYRRHSHNFKNKNYHYLIQFK